MTVVTPEHAPLSLFGEEASAAVAEELKWAGVDSTGAVARRDGRASCSSRRASASTSSASSRCRGSSGPASTACRCDEEGFIVAGDDALVEGCERTWAAGDGVVSPVKFGGLATHQARARSPAIARLAGVEDVPDPGEPVLHGRLLVGPPLAPAARARRRRGRAAVVAARQGRGRVPAALAGRARGDAAAPARAGRTRASRSASRSAMSGPEQQYLFELARQFRSDDPAIASLGRRMREARER